MNALTKAGKLAKAGTVLAAATLALAACGGSDTSDASSSNSGTASAASSESSGKSVCIIGGADAFFAVVKNGADAASLAVQDAGTDYTWMPLPTYENIGPDMVKLIQQAVSNGCTSLALPDWVPDAENPAIADAMDSGLSVVLYNAGGEPEVENTGALGYFGTDEYEAGKAAGEYLAENGATNVICVNTSPGSVNIEARCDGTKDGMEANGGTADQLVLPGKSFGDAAAISNAVKGALSQDPSIDGVMTISSADADAAAAGIQQAGSDALAGSFDISENILNRISDGSQLFAVDQQGWLQGFLAVSAAWQYDQYGILPATNIILTGPALVTADNVDQIVAGVKTGQR
ncbi:substrate-binding domain-containing protein [Nocardioides bruguierae]|uniref:substrate-binding domain-containing protein n=1 Tax=Nocardioides bruguierae TaxID=2945102 RepID=UPI002020E1C5|nr:substrate-binding domain-containing protein [Nocardioides bruguierae]MCL8023766.1 substrate-binding domain-containing protein [Nocardioides bruguierae]